MDINDIIGLIGILISGFIAYHIYALSKKITFKDKLKHKKKIKDYITQLKSEIHYEGRNSKIYLVDVDVYDKYYPNNSNKFNRYSYIAGGLKDATFEGVEIIDELIGVSSVDD